MKRFDITDTEGIQNEFWNMFRNSMAFYDGDPKEGGKRITFHEHLESMGIKFTPTGDFERMKIVREESYRKELQEVIERRKWNAGIETSESDIKEFRRLWLTDELERIKGWEKNNPLDRPENLLELKKYTRHINIGLETLEMPQQWKPLSNLNEYLLHLNRLLVELPDKLARLFPRAKLLPKNHWDESDRLLPDEYLVAVHRYNQLNLNNDTYLLQNIRLDPDFTFFLKDPTIDSKRISEQVANIQNVFDYLRMCQTYTSDFDINNVEEDKTALWNVTSGITEIMDWLVSLSELLNSCLSKTTNAPAPLTPLYTDDEDNFSLSQTANYRETNIWLKNRLHLALNSADNTVTHWLDSFLSDLKVETDRAEIVFHKHRNHYLAQRQQYIQYNNLYSEFFEKQSGFSEEMLQTLTNRVQTMYLNSTHSLSPETLIERVYANNFMINRLNVWNAENNPFTSTSTANDERSNVFNKHRPLDDVRKWFIQLAQNNSKNGKPFLPVEQVGQFIERAFIGNMSVQKLTLNYASREKLTLWKLFYQYYQNCVSFESGIERGVQCRDKYIKLLTDNFTNFTFEDVKANFAKSNQAKKDWNLLK